MEWRPISTYRPGIDPQKVFVIEPDFGMNIGEYIGGRWLCYDLQCGGPYEGKPYLWCPPPVLPDAPPQS